MTFALLRGYVQDLSDVFFINIECRFTYFEVIFLIRRRRDSRTPRTRFGKIMGRVLKLIQPVAEPTAARFSLTTYQLTSNLFRNNKISFNHITFLKFSNSSVNKKKF